MPTNHHNIISRIASLAVRSNALVHLIKAAEPKEIIINRFEDLAEKILSLSDLAGNIAYMPSYATNLIDMLDKLAFIAGKASKEIRQLIGTKNDGQAIIIVVIGVDAQIKVVNECAELVGRLDYEQCKPYAFNSQLTI